VSEHAIDPEARADRDRNKRLGSVCLPAPFRFSIAASSDAEFLASATRCVLSMTTGENE